MQLTGACIYCGKAHLGECTDMISARAYAAAVAAKTAANNPTEYRELLLGCGHSREKRIDPRRFNLKAHPGSDVKNEWRGELSTQDLYIGSDAGLVFDLNDHVWPYSDDAFDEVHAYDVLEHLAAQGDFRAFFDCFTKIWRILKVGGYLCGTTPSRYSSWLWGDPGHTRVVLPESLVFLSQPQYQQQQGVTRMSDYRQWYKADFDIIYSQDDHTDHAFVLRAVKPSRILTP